MKPNEEKGVKNEAGQMGCGERDKEFIGKSKGLKRVGLHTRVEGNENEEEKENGD